MSDMDRQPLDIHPTALLLPWYLSGQLAQSERSEVDAHLATCAACRAELESLTSLRTGVRAMFEEAPGPSARVRRAVMGRLDEPAVRLSLADRLAESAQRLLQPKWAPALALTVIAAQIGALGWLISGPGTIAGSANPGITSRDVAAGTTRLRIVFNPAARQADVLASLGGLHARIVDGPAADGAYVIELGAGSPQQTAAALRALRANPQLVERIEASAP